MWFESWSRLIAVVLAGVCGYVVLVLLLRVSGKRTLAKLNAFDFVVTIALGSVLATLLISRQIPVAEGVAGLAVLVGMQYVVAAATRRWPSARHLVTARPTALVVRGELRRDAMSRCRVTPEEVAAAVRQSGSGSLGDVEVVVLETDGTISVVGRVGDADALGDVEGMPCVPHGS